MKFNWLRSRRFWLLIVTGVLLALIASQLPLAAWFLTLNKTLQSLGIWKLPTFALIYLIATVLGLPNILLILLAGSLFGFFQGVVVASVIMLYAYMGSFGTYLLGDEITLEKVVIQGAGLLLAIGAALYTTRLVRKAMDA
jgi:hypothetical protein